MSRAGWSSFIGIFCAFVYGCLALYLFTGLVGVHNMGEEVKTEDKKSVDPDSKDENTKEELVQFSRHQVTSYTVLLVKDLVMMTVSILLVVGVKQQQYKFMTPWIFVGAVSIIVNLTSMVFIDQAEGTFVTEFISLVLTVAIWYPIYTYYKKVRCSQKSQAAVQNCMMTATAPYYAPCAPPANSVEVVHSTAVVASGPEK